MDVSLYSMVVAVVWYLADGLLQLFLIMLNKLPNTIIYIEGHRIILHHHGRRKLIIVLKLLLNLFKLLILIFNILDLFLLRTLKGSP